LPEATKKTLLELKNENVTFNCFSFVQDSGYVVIYNNNGFAYQNIPALAVDRLRAMNERGSIIKSIAFTAEGGYCILYDKNEYIYESIPPKAIEMLQELKAKDVTFKDIAFSPNNDFVILFDKNGFGCHFNE